MEFKYIAFWIVLICSVWALFVSGMTSIEELGNIELKSELEQVQSLEGESNFGSAPLENKFESIVKVLNTALPVSLICIVLLILTYKSNPIGLIGLSIAVVMFLWSSSKSMEAVDIIQAYSDFSVDARVWWM